MMKNKTHENANLVVSVSRTVSLGLSMEGVCEGMGKREEKKGKLSIFFLELG